MNKNDLSRNAEAQIMKILSDLERDAGCVVERAEMQEFDVSTTTENKTERCFRIFTREIPLD